MKHKVVQELSKGQGSTPAETKQNLPQTVSNTCAKLLEVLLSYTRFWSPCGVSVKDARALMPKEPSLQLYRLPFYFLISFSKKVEERNV